MTPRQLSDLASARNYYLFTIITITCGDENVHCCTLGYFRSLFFFFFFSLKKKEIKKQNFVVFAGWGRSWSLSTLHHRAGCAWLNGHALHSNQAPPHAAPRPTAPRPHLEDRPACSSSNSSSSSPTLLDFHCRNESGWQLLPAPFLCHSENEVNDAEH